MCLAKQQGAALIMAIFIVAITAILATAMTLSLRNFIAQTELIQNNDKLHLDLQGVQYWAKAMIKQYAINPKKVIQINTSPNAPMFKLVMKFNQATVNARVYDAQSLFNLNNLIYTEFQPNLMRLLQIIMPTIKASQAHQIAVALSQRLADKKRGLLISAQEMRTLPAVNASTMQHLLPYVIAIPISQKQSLPVDINGASIPVLMSLSAQVSAAKAQALWSCRKSHGWFFNQAQYRANCEKRLALSGLNISNHTNFFLLKATAKYHGVSMHLTSLLQLMIVNKQPKVNVLWVSV